MQVTKWPSNDQSGGFFLSPSIHCYKPNNILENKGDLKQSEKGLCTITEITYLGLFIHSQQAFFNSLIYPFFPVRDGWIA